MDHYGLGQAEEHARRRVATEAGVQKVRVRAESGEAANVLVRVADEAGVDVIVVGSKGMAAASRFLLGRVPDKVSHYAPLRCPHRAYGGRRTPTRSIFGGGVDWGRICR